METTQSTTQTRSHHRKNKVADKIPLPRTSKHLNSLLEWYDRPNLKNVKDVPLHYSRDAFFKDPFTEIYTAEEIQKYYQHTFEKIKDTRFVFENILEKDNQAFVTWIMTAQFMGREFNVQGSTHLKFNSSGLCEYHRDYFDLSEEIYEQLPLLGYIFKGIKRALN